MKKTLLGSIADIQTGPFGSQLHKEDYVEKGTPIVTVEHLGNRVFTEQNLPMVSDYDKERLNKYVLCEGDIVFSRVGSVDRCSYVDSNHSGWMFSGRCLRVRPSNILYPLYLYYYFCMESTKRFVRNIAVGATMPSINTKLMGEVEISVPSIDTQKRIATILSSIDDKIELNAAINENLEQQAQAIFKSWFVDFEPFGGVMPDDWQLKPISQLDVLVTDYVANGSFKSLSQNVEYQSEETDNVLIRLTDYNNNYSSDLVYITDSAYEFLAKSKLFGDEIIISNVGVNVGTVFRCPRLNKRMSLAPNSIMLRSDLLGHYLYLHFTSQYGQQQLQSIVTGSAQPKFNKTNFRSLNILLPNSKILERFNTIYAPIYDLIATNFIENQRLASLRDTLLPKLMNGEIDVSQVEI